MTIITGWDIGGAHLKVARVENKRVLDARQYPSLIWTDTNELECAIRKASETFGDADFHAVTMTGELAEIFLNRAEGVEHLIVLFESILEDHRISYFAGMKGFVSSENAIQHPNNIASANWLASATLSASKAEEGIFVDIGSTTTDLIPIYGGQPKPLAFNDADRLTEGELIYTGAIRTPVMAVTEKVPFEGRWQSLMGERFATMSDVYRVLGLLPEKADQFPAVDGREKTPEASCRRLARMLGRDFDAAETWKWEEVSRFLATCQMAAIEDNLHLAFSRIPVPPTAPVIGAGSGSFIVRTIAKRMNRPYMEFSNLMEAGPQCRDWIEACAPAVSVAMLFETD